MKRIANNHTGFAPSRLRVRWRLPRSIRRFLDFLADRFNVLADATDGVAGVECEGACHKGDQGNFANHIKVSVNHYQASLASQDCLQAE